MANFPVGELTADELNAAFPLTKVKTADETVTSSATPQNDDHLFVSVAANKTYIVEAYLVVTSTSATPDFRLDFTVPSGATMPVRTLFAQPTGNTTTSGTIDTSVATAAGTDDTAQSINGTTGMHLEGTLIVDATAGTFQLRWSQATSDAAGVTLKAGSWLKLTPVD